MSETGIHTIDTGFVRPGFDAAYLLVQDGHAAFIDCGTSHSVPRLLEALRRATLEPAQVEWLILTHVHLDHAGGAGELLARLPHARLLVHPRGARHMIDPRQLWAGASAVYGEALMREHYGELRPVPAERVVEAHDGHRLALGSRQLTCLDTPGHARHHMVIHDPAAAVCFTGDTFGLSYRELDGPRGPFVLPTTTPVQFDPAALHASIERLLALRPRAMYLTHYGRVAEVERLAAELHQQIDAMVAIAQARRADADRHQSLVADLAELYGQRALAHGVPLERSAVLELLRSDIELNAQGLGVWLDGLDGKPRG